MADSAIGEVAVTLDGKEFRATAKQFLAFMNPLAAAGCGCGSSFAV